MVGKAIYHLDRYSLHDRRVRLDGTALAALDSRDLLGRFGPYGRAGRRQAAVADLRAKAVALGTYVFTFAVMTTLSIFPGNAWGTRH